MPAPTQSDIVNALLDANFYWGGSVVTFSIPSIGATWPGYATGEEPSDPGYGVLTQSQAARFRSAADAWDKLIGISMVETTDWITPGAIRVAFTDVGDFWGYAYSPPFRGGVGSPVSGDIWIASREAGASFTPGDFDYMSLLHEIGHALGLKHPFEPPVLDPAYDNLRYTVMSYTAQPDWIWMNFKALPGGGLSTDPSGVFPTTPMVFDIVAIQALYGLSLTANTGDTIYSWNDSGPVFECVFDSGGTDTFDLRGSSRSSIIDLNPGAFSSVSYYSIVSQISYWTSQFPLYSTFILAQLDAPTTFTWSNNVGIAYSTIIENVTGSAYADTIVGNAAANAFIGGSGNDLLDGGAGSDSAGWSGSRSQFLVRSFVSGGSTYTYAIDQVGSEGTDTVVNVEAFGFAGGANYGFAGIQQNHLSSFDGGRFDDVLFRNVATGQIIYQDMTGGALGGFKNILGGLPAGWKVVASGDLTNDGKAELFIQDGNTGSIYTFNAGVWGVVTTSITSAWEVKGVGDFTGDGALDALIRDAGTGVLVYAELDAGGAFAGWANAGNLGLGWRTVGVGDFDRDGFSDIAFQNIADGTTYYANYDAGLFAGWGYVTGAVGTAWIAKEIADLDGDGYFDVLYENDATGQIWYVDMGAGLNQWGVVANNLGQGWELRATADVDNDGYLDAIVQNLADGTTYFADINAGNFAAWGNVAGTLGTQWIVA